MRSCESQPKPLSGNADGGGAATAAGSEDKLDQMRVAVEQMAEQVRALATRLPAQRALSKRQAARLLGVSRGRTLDQLIRDGTIRTVRVGTRSKIPMAELERLLVEGAQAAPRPLVPVRKAATRRVNTRPPNLAQELAKARTLKVSDL